MSNQAQPDQSPDSGEVSGSESDSSGGWDSQPKPVRLYDGNLNDADLFRYKRHSRSHSRSLQPGVREYLDEKLDEHLVEYLTNFVDYIYDAFLQCNQVLDEKTADGADAEAVELMKNGYWSNDQIRTSSWGVLIMCIDVQAGAGVGTDIVRKEFGSWQERLRAVYDNLWWRKSVCKEWLDEDYDPLWLRLVRDPLGYYRSIVEAEKQEPEELKPEDVEEDK